VSATQLSRWREIDLLGRYERRGLGRAKGQTVFYWFGAHRLAVFIVRQLRKTRDFDVVGWKAWLEGFPVTAFARDLLCREVDRWAKEAERQFAPRDTTPRGPRRRGERKVPPSVAEQVRAIQLQMPLASALMLGHRAEHGDVSMYLQSQGQAMPKDWQSAVRRWEGAGNALRLDHLHAAIAGATDAELERLRDDMLVCWCATAQRALEIRYPLPDHSPAMMLMWIGFARAGQPTGFLLAEIFRGGAIKLVRSRTIPSEHQATVDRLRYWRKEIRRARRKRKLL
jgi:hypothetical protein